MASAEDDIQIVIRGCIKNDRKAQEQLYKRFYHAMMVLCVRYTKDSQDAIEVLNDGFLKVFRNIGNYQPEKASFYTWVRTIVIHTAIDFLRKQQAYPETGGISEGVDEPSIDNEALGKLSGEEVLKMIRQLPAATGLVFNLYAVDGFNHREIGTLLGISEGTSRWHLSEARKQLKTLIYLMKRNP
ncbi:MAG TPA: RNA polymerase sigma factor [Puia sp.]|nr:RNA polymerase sigma factor [Puia sp.]